MKDLMIYLVERGKGGLLIDAATGLSFKLTTYARSMFSAENHSVLLTYLSFPCVLRSVAIVLLDWRA